MPNLRDIRIRINSIKSIQQITSAMKVVAASKLRKAQERIINIRPYTAKLKELLNDLLTSIDDLSDNPFIKNTKKQPETKKVLLVVICSNRGLCGAFNSGVIKKVVNNISTKYSHSYKAGNLALMCIGKKSYDFFKRRKYNIIGNYGEIFSKLTYENSSEIAEKLINYYLKGEYDIIEFIYNQFKNAAVQILTEEQFLPIEIKIPNTSKTDYIFEPEKQEMLNELIPKMLKLQFYKALLDSNASEHGARMTAMHKATDNASELIKDLTLAYNKARQAGITKEIIEIVTGAQALKG